MSGGATTSIRLHVLGIPDDGRLWHTGQPMLDDGSMGSWGDWEEVKAPGSQQPGSFVNVDCVSTWKDFQGADAQEELHVLGITQDAKLWYTHRLGQQAWQPFEDFGTSIGGNQWNFRHVGVTEVNGQLDACVIVSVEHGAQRILHTQRPWGSTSWQQFEEVTQPNLAGFPGSFISVDCAYTWIGLLAVLQVCGITHDGNLWHTIRFASPTWLPFANVALLSSDAPTPFANVSLAQGFNTLELCVQANGILWHTSRLSMTPPQFSLKQPRWQSTFDNVSTQAGEAGAFGSIGCGDVNGTLHACGVTDDGKLWHTVRTSTNPPAWHPFENLTTVVGNPGHFIFACVANSTPPPSFGGSDQTCSQIQMCIGNDSLQIQALQRQEASTTNSAAIAQMNQQIAGLRQDITSLQQQAQQYKCP